MTILLRTSLSYFLIVFAAGFALGTVRVLLVVDAIGERNAELVESPVMAIVCAFAARYLVTKHRAKLNVARAALMGLIALSLLLIVEFTVVLSLRGLSLSEYFQTRDPVSGMAYIAGLVWYAAAPIVFYIYGSKR